MDDRQPPTRRRFANAPILGNPIPRPSVGQRSTQRFPFGLFTILDELVGLLLRALYAQVTSAKLLHDRFNPSPAWLGIGSKFYDFWI